MLLTSAASSAGEARYEFDKFNFESAPGRLTANGQEVPLPANAVKILRFLLRHQGKLVSKELLMETVWPDSEVEENNLAHHVSVLRKALGDEPPNHKFIETVPRRGYRFVATVTATGVAADGLPAQTIGEIIESPPPENGLRSLAVLPFKTIGIESGDEYFGIGMADAIITRLSSLPRVSIRPTSAVLRYVGRETETVAAAQELKASLILEGMVQKAADRIRLTVQLVDAEQGSPVWAGKYDEQMKDIFSLQDVIAERVAFALSQSLPDPEKRRFAKHDTENVDAYQFYLKGRHFYSQFTLEYLSKAVECYAAAIKFDPAYAKAYAGFAECQILLGDMLLPPQECYAKAAALAVKAHDLDPLLPGPRVMLAAVKAALDWDWAGAEEEYKRAIDLDPHQIKSRLWYACFLATQGRFDEALAQTARAQLDDPLSAHLHSFTALVHYYRRSYDHAAAECLKSLEINRHFPLARRYLGKIYEQQGRHKDARQEMEAAIHAAGRPAHWLADLCHAFASAGHDEEARAVLRELQEIARRQYLSPYCLAVAHLGLGDLDETFAHLEAATRDRPWQLMELNVAPYFDGLRSDPRLREILSRLNLD